MESITVAELATRVRASVRIDSRPIPLFTFLLGSGFSLSAGLPSTEDLVAVLQARLKEHGAPEYRSWSELLSQRRAGELKAISDGSSPTMLYQQLLNNPQLFPFTTARQLFITEVVRWAAGQKVEINEESLLLATILIAGAQHSHDATKDDKGRSSDISRFIAHTAYTTNFDEVLPQTFRYFGEPVAVVDHVGAHGRAQGFARYPRIVYLHGSHLFYDLRNTENEIREADGDRTGGVDLNGLFQRFREVLRTSGLIVLGYSGWPDRALAAIRDALADRESLPFNLYWGAYPGVDSLSHHARTLLDEHPGRAFVLEPGKAAKEVLESMMTNFALKEAHDENMKRWQSRTRLLEELFKTMRAHPAVSEAAISTVGAPAAPEEEASLGWTVRAGALTADLRERTFTKGLNDIGEAIRSVEELIDGAVGELRLSHEFRGLVLLKAQLLGYQADPRKCVAACEEALLHYRTAHDEVGTLGALLTLGQALARDHRPGRAEKTLTEMVEIAQRINFDLGVIFGSLALARIVAFFKFEPTFALELAGTAERLARLEDDDLKASVIFFKADFESTFGELDTADYRYGEALDYAKNLNDRALILLSAATNAIRAGQIPRAQRMLDEAAEIADNLKFETIEASILGEKAVVAAAVGDTVSAQNAFSDSLAALERIGSPHALADTLIDYAKFLLQSIQINKAAAVVERALTIGEDVESRHVVSRAHITAASIALRRDNLDEAEALIAKATTLDVERARKSKALRLRAQVMLSRGDRAQAMQFLKEAHDVDHARHDHRGVAETLFRMSEVHLRQEEFEPAMETASRAREALSKVNDRRLLGYALVIEGRIMLAKGTTGAARERHYQARTHFEKYGDAYGAMLADLYLAPNDFDQLQQLQKSALEAGELKISREAEEALEKLRGAVATTGSASQTPH